MLMLFLVGSGCSNNRDSTLPDGESEATSDVKGTRPSSDECGTVDDEMIHRGEVLFSGKGNCSTCHKGDGTGSAIGPDLTDSTWLNIEGDFESIARNIRNGVPLPIEHPTPMPAMGGAKLTDEQICDLAAYVWSLSE